MLAHVGFDDAHRRLIPERLSEKWGSLAGNLVTGEPPIAFKLPDGLSYSYVPQTGDGTIEVVAGERAATVLELDETSWKGLWESTETFFGLLMSGRASLVSGEARDLIRWESAIRVLYEEIPPFDPDLPLLWSNGKELDPRETFQPDDDPARMAEFLRSTGYLVVRKVFSDSEARDLLTVAEQARLTATEEDGMSWWSTHEDGHRYPCRVLNGGRDKKMEALPSDPRLLKIVGLSDFPLEPAANEGVSILYKQSGAVFDGKADQPWHRDCGLGGHALMCPLMNGSLYLTDANRAAGELRFLPGSWRTAGCVVDDPGFQLGVSIEAGPGDFSLHYGDGLHAGTPPESKNGPFRRSVVFEYGPVGRTPEQSQEHYDQLMQESDAKTFRPT